MCWTAFPLHPETPEEGRSLEELFSGRNPEDIAEAMARLKRVAHDLGLPMVERMKTYNSRLAQELGKWAETEGKGDAFHHAAFRAYFAEGLNLAKMEILLDIAADVGLDMAKARTVLEERTFSAAVDRDWERSAEMNIRAVPTFVMGRQRLVGAQSDANLARLMQQNGVKLGS